MDSCRMWKKDGPKIQALKQAVLARKKNNPDK
jgi:hypothetical protein